MKKILFCVAALGLLGLAGAGIGLKAQDTVEAKAADPEYYLTGNFYDDEAGDYVEHWTNYKACPSDGVNIGVIKNVELHYGDTLKFKKASTWDNALDFGKINAGDAQNSFYWQVNSTNIYCGASGLYDFTIYDDDGSHKIRVDYSSSNPATYTYVLTTESEFYNIYMWKGDQKQRDWEVAPVVNGRGYGVKFTYNAYDFYGLYRIDDRVLNGWSNFKLKNADGSKQSGFDLTHTAGNAQEVLLVNDGTSSVTAKNVSSAEYKAIEFLYDIAAERGAATYDGTDFADSICATSYETATALVSKYGSLGDEAKDILSSSWYQLYNVDSKPYGEGTKKYYTIEKIVDALQIIVDRGPSVGVGSVNALTEKGNETMAWTVAGVFGLLAIMSGAVVIARKRRTE